jgi:hypothetical protein
MVVMLVTEDGLATGLVGETGIGLTPAPGANEEALL